MNKLVALTLLGLCTLSFSLSSANVEKTKLRKVDVKLFDEKLERAFEQFKMSKIKSTMALVAEKKSSLLTQGPMQFSTIMKSGRDCHGENHDDNSCVTAVCDAVGIYGCNDSWEIEKVIDLCKGRVDGDCVKTICKFRGEYGCNDSWEIEKVVGICKENNLDGHCINVVCEKLGQYSCNDEWEIEKVGALCKDGVSGSCIASVCEKLGEYGCNDSWEIEKVVGLCKE
ncbi:MAG: hypothetical protein A2504_04120 [Bdellovibrionales bacterium RIFOXYD12_FULL_39_22]|nr:MAG: hypothetical protein A2385_11870 [Bdellovibrionales bacterium RIFOXYB1_FULL_39_21]OFZ41758.1 MAG: hypothetical protein A2485_02180 [Bdellovibrionales bacterium RIFOXYC12_FULL_39_17]OFZ46158.1 MAG: hypothetical protein A2404_12545 [Bdellovibrionales bacterium RIFOXYC1_FULL_39_130]OFZ74984.1 MAG: hypothetical protein A2560_15585 [Bdellovibrionales bacterium RIFOXYD1_FULL_39_84]OFZ76257.1 MAG: hypothetical protein A2451_05425 [Bdellovibrionales bacterium RIFOXYC2_FULL_39_8]OFZ92837.1 MAG: